MRDPQSRDARCVRLGLSFDFLFGHFLETLSRTARPTLRAGRRPPATSRSSTVASLGDQVHVTPPNDTYGRSEQGGVAKVREHLNQDHRAAREKMTILIVKTR